MTRAIFVNLPVKDLERSKAFFAALGFTYDAQFTGDHAACMVIGPNHYVMLLVESFFQNFTRKAIADAKQSTEVLIALQLEDRQAVTGMVTAAVKAGGTSPMPPQDHGFMYQHSFEDLDGHQWEPFCMNAPPPK